MECSLHLTTIFPAISKGNIFLHINATFVKRNLVHNKNRKNVQETIMIFIVNLQIATLRQNSNNNLCDMKHHMKKLENTSSRGIKRMFLRKSRKNLNLLICHHLHFYLPPNLYNPSLQVHKVVSEIFYLSLATSLIKIGIC